MKTYVHKILHTNVYGSFIHHPPPPFPPQNWKQQRCSSVDEFANKLRHIHTMGYYSALKRNEQPNHEMIWRRLNYILLSDTVDLKRLDKFQIPILWNSGKNETKDGKQISGRQGVRERWVKLNRWKTVYFLG